MSTLRRLTLLQCLRPVLADNGMARRAQRPKATVGQDGKDGSAINQIRGLLIEALPAPKGRAKYRAKRHGREQMAASTFAGRLRPFSNDSCNKSAHH